MSLPQLRDALDRQERVLANVKLLRTLPDGGAKVRSKKAHLQSLVAERERAADEAADLLAGLSVAGERVESVEEMEFRFGAGVARHLEGQRRVQLDSDDDEDNDGEDPLKVLAEKELPSSSKRKMEDSVGLFKEKDDNEVDLFAVKRSSKVDSTRSKDRFMPFAAGKERAAEGKKPPSVMELPANWTSKTKMLSLEESLRVQREQQEREREVRLQQAMDRLKKSAAGDTVHASHPAGLTSAMDYREKEEEFDEDEEEAEDDVDEDPGVSVSSFS